MYQYRVTKYDPQFRVNGVYTRAEWSSIADVGEHFDGVRFTMDEYERVEKCHIDFLCALAERCDVFPLAIDAYEVYVGKTCREGQKINSAELHDIVRSVLREECWCRLVSREFFIHFGYDYYMYVGCELSVEDVSELAEKHNLFCEECTSPYHDEGES